MLADVFENFRNMSLEIYKIDPANDLPVLLEIMNIEKVENLVANWHHKTEYIIHIKNLKQTLNHGLFWKGYIEGLNLIKRLGSNGTLTWIPS